MSLVRLWMSALGNAIQKIFTLRADKEMFGIDTSCVIAFVQNLKARCAVET
jgi:hypothetical protein